MHFRSLTTRGHPLTTWTLALHYTTVALHLGLQFPSSIALTTHTKLIALMTHTRSWLHWLHALLKPWTMARQGKARRDIAYITLIAIASLWSPLCCPRPASLCLASLCLALPCLGLPCLFSRVLILARVSWINPLPCHLDSVCTSLGLLLVYLDYLSALPCWILFADRRPMLALGRACLVCVVPVCHCMNLACFVTMPFNKSLGLDPHASRLVGSMTVFKFVLHN